MVEVIVKVQEMACDGPRDFVKIVLGLSNSVSSPSRLKLFPGASKPCFRFFPVQVISDYECRVPSSCRDKSHYQHYCLTLVSSFENASAGSLPCLSGH